MPNPPAWMTKAQKRAYKRLVSVLPTLTDRDLPMLEAAASALGIVEDASRDIRDRGILVERRMGGYNGAELRVETIKNPAVGILHDALNDWHKAANALGLGADVRKALAEGRTVSIDDIPGLKKLRAVG